MPYNYNHTHTLATAYDMPLQFLPHTQRDIAHDIPLQ